MEIKIEIPQNIILDKKRLKSIEQGILKLYQKVLMKKALAFKYCKGDI